MSVTGEQRFTRGSPCPICGGFDAMVRGKDKRCAGYASLDGKWSFCQRIAAGAHHQVPDSTPPTWAHLLRDEPLVHHGNGYSAPVRRLDVVERELKAVENLSESARTADEYEGDRDNYDRLWAEVEAIKTNAVMKPTEAPVVQWVGLSELAKPVPPPEWLCEGLKLAKGPVNCVAGYGYSGKTAIAQALLLCIATGKALFGLFHVTQMPVGWMDYEQGKRMSAGRLQRQARGLGIDLSSYPSNALRYAEYPDVYLSEKGDGVDRVAKAVDGMGLCLLDSAKALTPGIDENDSRIRVPFDALSRVSMKTGCTFLVIHHYGKSGVGDSAKPLKERMRGSSALFDAMQTVWGLDAKDKETYTRCSLSKDRVTNVKSLEFGVQFVDDAATDSVVLKHLDPEQMKNPTKAALYMANVLETVKRNPQLTSVEQVRFHMSEGFRNCNETRAAIRELQESNRLVTINNVYRAV